MLMVRFPSETGHVDIDLQNVRAMRRSLEGCASFALQSVEVQTTAPWEQLMERLAQAIDKPDWSIRAT